MSGICGWMGYGGAAAESRQLAEAMGAPLVRFDHATLASIQGSRSAVAVAAAADQALLWQQDKLLLAVWGEVKLRDPALAEQARLHGAGPVLAARWREGAQQVCAALAGTFALCIIDEGAGETLLACDRMGTVPLIYQVAGDALVFASSADALLRHPLTPARLDHQALYNYTFFHMVPGPDTVYQNQQRLLPGEYLHFKRGTATTGAYWRVQFDESGTRSMAELQQEFRAVLRSSVQDSIGARKVGAFLSGGTDSSTIAGVMCEVAGKGANTYSIGFEAQGYDEMEFARTASRHFGTAHHEYYVTPDDVVAAIPQIASVFDQPFGNASAVPAFYCARMAKADGIERIFGGDGGDELFGGNERYSKQHVFALYDRVPGLVRKALLEPLVFNRPGGHLVNVVRKARSYIQQASVPMPARLETYNLLERYGAHEVFTADFLATTNSGAPLAGLAASYGRSEANSLINRMLALDLKVTLADNDLPKVAKACELAGIEVAFPFLNDEMVAFASRLTPRQKLNGTKLRYFFKEALRGFLPDEIINKQKHGFGLPFGVWLQHHKPLQQLAIDSLTDLKARNIVRPEFIDQLVGHHLKEHAGYHGTMVWVLMMMEQWFQQRRDVR